MERRTIHSSIWTFVVCGVAGIALVGPTAAKDIAYNPGGAVDFYATVNAVREVPAGNPMPGLHFDAKVKGRVMDIYVAPMDFVAKYGVKISKGAEVHVVGMQEEADMVLARSITTGSSDTKTGAFHEDMTVYLRNDDGPFWDEAGPGPQPVAAH